MCSKLFTPVEDHYCNEQKKSKSQTLVYYIFMSSSCLVNTLFLVWEVCLLQCEPSRRYQSNLKAANSIYIRERQREFLLGSYWSLNVHGQTCSVCVTLEQIYEEMLMFPQAFSLVFEITSSRLDFI